MRCEDHGVFREFDDVDLLAAQLTDDRLHPHTLHAHASTHAIYITIAALHGDFGPLTGLAGTPADHDRAVVNFGDFLFEQAHHQLRRRAGHQHARSLARFVDQLDNAADPVAYTVALQARLLFFRELGFRLSEVENVIRAFNALDGAVHQLAGAARVL